MSAYFEALYITVLLFTSTLYFQVELKSSLEAVLYSSQINFAIPSFSIGVFVKCKNGTASWNLGIKKLSQALRL